MNNKTMILIKKETAKLMKKMAIAKYETYDEIINRLIKKSEKNE